MAIRYIAESDSYIIDGKVVPATTLTEDEKRKLNAGAFMNNRLTEVPPTQGQVL